MVSFKRIRGVTCPALFDQPVSSMPSPLTRYQEKIQNNEITFDHKQQDALAGDWSIFIIN